MTPETKERAARAAIGALFFTKPESVQVMDADNIVPNRWQAWVSTKDFEAVMDAIEAAVETAVPA